MNDMLKAADVAKILNVSKRYAYYLIQRGEIPVIDLGPNCKRVPRDQLERYIEDKSNNAPTS